ncbi:MAG: ZIP family metal transporter [Planctomycetaceae bacterium]
MFFFSFILTALLWLVHGTLPVHTLPTPLPDGLQSAADDTGSDTDTDTGTGTGPGAISSAPGTVVPTDVTKTRAVPTDPATVTRRTWLLTCYCAAIILSSLFGGWLPSIWQMTHTATQTLTSFVGGLMLGIAVFHLLPHSLHGHQTPDQMAWWLMAGILAMFLLIRCFHFHHHGPLEISTEKEDPCADHPPLLPQVDHPRSGTNRISAAAMDCRHDHDHDHDHDHQPQHQQAPHCHHAHKLSWIGITVGLSLHTLLDGMALAASVHAESGHQVWLSLFGFGTFLAILLHKPLDAVSITSLMRAGGWSRRSRFWVNLCFSCMCPLGALLFSAGLTSLDGLQQPLIDAALAFSAGIFLCISLSDLLPEMEFHAHNRLQLTVALLAGILLAYGIRFLEPSWMH